MSLFRKRSLPASPEMIAAILASTESQHATARRLGVSQALVWRVKNNRDGNDKPRQENAA